MKTCYRRDIDGLRAIAIIAVLLFHLAPNWFKGGFLGVDIFFVISGFLITQIILTEISSGYFSIIKFYERRIVRIFPALILVLLSCLAMGWFIQTATEFESLGKHVIASSGFVSNFLLWSEVGYFDSEAATKPLLHLWSIAVEEQFYIFFPAIILIALYLKVNISLLISISIFISLIFTYIFSGIYNYSNEIFYLPFTRAWELCFGALLANFYIYNHRFKKAATKVNESLKIFIFFKNVKEIDILSNCISIVGVALIFYSFFMVNSGESFSLFITLPTVIGSCCLIICGPNSFFNNYCLSNKVLVYIGLISYPLYLWHWPFLSMAKYLNLPSIINLPLVLMTLFLSWLTYIFIENPIRQKSNKRKSSCFLIIGMLITATFALLIFSKDGVPSRYQKYQGEFYLNGSFRINKDINFEKCENAIGVIDSWCRTTKNPRTVLIGDSHIDQLFPRFVENNDEKFSKVISIGAGNCPPLILPNYGERCIKQIRHTLQNLKLYPNLEFAIISSWNLPYGNPEKAIKGFKPVVEKLLNKGLKIAIIVDNPTLKLDPRNCNLAWPAVKLLISKSPEYCTSPTLNDFEPYVNYKNFIKKFKKLYPDIFVFDPLSIFCKGSVCKIRSGKIMNYSDEGHISPFLAKKVVDAFVETAKANGFRKK